MYNTNVAGTVYTNRMVSAAARLYELLKLAIKPSVYKNNNSKEYLPYILNAISKGYTVLDVGTHRRAYLFDILKISKLPGRLITLEGGFTNYTYLEKMRQLLNLHNITIEPQGVSKQSNIYTNSSSRRNGATIIDFKTKLEKQNHETTEGDVIDHYCAMNSTVPALIKIKLDGNDLSVLYGAREIMRKYKPQMLVETTERSVSRETLMTVFSYLNKSNYVGYFLLDTIKVPLTSFDFNIYQNEVLGYYCNNFLFE